MNKKFGIHFYLNIDNLNQILRRDENKNDDLKRSFHQLETFVDSIEKFVENFKDCVVEKFTTSRLHLYYVIETNKDNYRNDLKNAIVRVMQIICFSKCLVNDFKNIGKYKNLPDFKIGVGVDIGEFVEFEFINDEIKELTTIGSPANRAAKLQSSISNDEKNDILISKSFFDYMGYDLTNFQGLFYGRDDLSNKIASHKNYADLTVYGGSINKLITEVNKYKNWEQRKNSGLEFARNKANQTDFCEIDFTGSRNKIDFSELSLRNPKIVTGAMFYSDIRGFTNKVDMYELQEAENLTKNILRNMYVNGNNNQGVHIQFQGDRESAVFYDHNDMIEDHILASVITGTKLLDYIYDYNIKNYKKIDVGIGISCGDIFLSRVGLKNGKFNIALGETVRIADKAEDEKAGVLPQNPTSEIAITKIMYNYMLELSKSNEEARVIINSFKPFSQSNEYYVSSLKYSEINDLIDNEDNRAKSFLPNIIHRKEICWNLPKSAQFAIKCLYSIDEGVSWNEYKEGQVLPKEAILNFTPKSFPYGWENCSIKWQITNTGYEAEVVKQLRGEINDSNIELKNSKYTGRKEYTKYRGIHYIQCFFVKNNRDCVAISKYLRIKIGRK